MDHLYLMLLTNLLDLLQATPHSSPRDLLPLTLPISQSVPRDLPSLRLLRDPTHRILLTLPLDLRDPSAHIHTRLPISPLLLISQTVLLDHLPHISQLDLPHLTLLISQLDLSLLTDLRDITVLLRLLTSHKVPRLLKLTNPMIYQIKIGGLMIRCI